MVETWVPGGYETIEKLTASEKKAYNALTPEEKTNVNKNKTLSQLKSALGGYEPDYEGGD